MLVGNTILWILWASLMLHWSGGVSLGHRRAKEGKHLTLQLEEPTAVHPERNDAVEQEVTEEALEKPPEEENRPAEILIDSKFLTSELYGPDPNTIKPTSVDVLRTS